MWHEPQNIQLLTCYLCSSPDHWGKTAKQKTERPAGNIVRADEFLEVCRSALLHPDVLNMETSWVDGFNPCRYVTGSRFTQKVLDWFLWNVSGGGVWFRSDSVSVSCPSRSCVIQPGLIREKMSLDISCKTFKHQICFIIPPRDRVEIDSGNILLTDVIYQVNQVCCVRTSGNVNEAKSAGLSTSSIFLCPAAVCLCTVTSPSNHVSQVMWAELESSGLLCFVVIWRSTASSERHQPKQSWSQPEASAPNHIKKDFRKRPQSSKQETLHSRCSHDYRALKSQRFHPATHGTRTSSDG